MSAFATRKVNVPGTEIVLALSSKPGASTVTVLAICVPWDACHGACIVSCKLVLFAPLLSSVGTVVGVSASRAGHDVFGRSTTLNPLCPIVTDEFPTVTGDDANV